MYLQLFKLWLDESKKKWRQQRENKWNETGLTEAAERNSLAFTGKAILTLNAFASESIQLIFDSTTKPRKKSDLLLPARKIGSGAKQKATRGLVPIRESKRKRSPLKAFAPSMKIMPRFIIDEETRTQSVCPHLKASYSVGRKKVLQVKITVKWSIPDQRPKQLLCSFGGAQACATKRNVELMAVETANASRPHKSLKTYDNIYAVELSQSIIPRFITDDEQRTESISPQLEASLSKGRRKLLKMSVTVKWGFPNKYQATQIDSVGDDQYLCRERKGLSVKVVPEATKSVASRRQKSPGLSHVLFARTADAVELVSEGSVKASRPHKSLNIPEEMVANGQSRYIVPRLAIDEEKGTESIYPNLEASFSKGRRKLLKMSVTVKWGIAGKRREKLMGRVVDDQAPRRKRNGLPVEVLSEATNSDASFRRKSTRLTHFWVNEVVFAWDKGHLYEATVSTWRDAKDGCVEYYVHYLGFGTRHDKWLATKDIMKCTPATREFYNKCTSWPLKASDAWT